MAVAALGTTPCSGCLPITPHLSVGWGCPDPASSHILHLTTICTSCCGCIYAGSNRHIAQWSGTYSIPAGQMLWADIKDVTFVPKGYAYCVKPDRDLEPSAE